MASPIRVLPLVASTTVCPGLSRPVRSASSMTPRAKRSLTDPMGLKASILTYRATCAGASFLILTTGVRPIVSRMLSNRFLARASLAGPATGMSRASLFTVMSSPSTHRIIYERFQPTEPFAVARTIMSCQGRSQHLTAVSACRRPSGTPQGRPLSWRRLQSYSEVTPRSFNIVVFFLGGTELYRGFGGKRTWRRGHALCQSERDQPRVLGGAQPGVPVPHGREAQPVHGWVLGRVGEFVDVVS